MTSASQGCQLNLFNPERLENFRNSKELFVELMARHLLGNMVTALVEDGVVNLDCMQRISRMSLDDAMRFLSNSPLINSRNLPVAKGFLKCADEAMVEQIFAHTRELALNYVSDCTHLATNDCEVERGN